MKQQYSMLAVGCLLLCGLTALVFRPEQTSTTATLAYFLLPLAAVTFALIAVRRHETPLVAITCLLLAAIYLLALILGWLSWYDAGMLGPDTCSSSVPLRCDTIMLSRDPSFLSFQLGSTAPFTLDMRTAVAVATIDGVAEPPLCSVQPETVQPGESALVTCTYGDLQLPRGKARGRFGVDFRDNHGEPVQVVGTFSVR